MQVSFEGVTGHVSFDESGLRQDYSLDVLELSLQSEPRKVCSIKCTIDKGSCLITMFQKEKTVLATK